VAWRAAVARAVAVDQRSSGSLASARCTTGSSRWGMSIRSADGAAAVPRRGPERLLGTLKREDHAARNQEEQHAAERVDVRPRTDRPAADLLGSEVIRRAHDHPSARLPSAAQPPGARGTPDRRRARARSASAPPAARAPNPRPQRRLPSHHHRSTAQADTRRRENRSKRPPHRRSAGHARRQQLNGIRAEEPLVAGAA
jgi:hypothetical protein